MAKTKKPTVDTCVVSHKPIRQKHIDDKKVMSYGKGRAFIAAIQKSVGKPPSNPIVLSGKDLDKITLEFEDWHFPCRTKIAGKVYSSLPPRIYILNAAFKLTNKIDFSFAFNGVVDKTEDRLIRKGKVTYQRIPDHHKIAQKPVDTTSDK